MPKRQAFRQLLPSYQRLLLSTAPLVLAFAAVPVSVTAADWTGGAGNNDWFDAGNWSSNAVPDFSADVVIAPGTVSLSGAATANSVSVEATSTLTVAGGASTLSAAETRVVDGTLNVTGGASVTNSSGVVDGVALVSGTDGFGNASTWTSNDYFGVGDSGDGDLQVLFGGKLIVNADTYIGGTNEGKVLVSGDGSSWENAGRITVSNGILRIEDRGQVSSGLATIGDTDTSSATVSGTSSSWSISDQLTVGSYASGTLRIEDGATVSSQQGYVGAGAAGFGSVTVTGAGSSWSIGDYNLNLGNYGLGDITIEDGASVYVRDGVWLGISSSTAVGALDINGTVGARGVLETNFVRGGMGTANVTLDGGIIRATRNNSAFFTGFGSQQVLLDANGAFFDTNGYNIGVAPELTGTGALTKQGSGTLTLTGTNSYTGGTIIADGTLRLGNNGTTGSILGDVANDGILAFNRSDSVTFGGTISGSGGVQQVGSGQTILTANNSALHGVSGVYDGILSVNNTLGGTMEVHGGRLQGIGQVGTTTNFAGGTIAPGNSIGTLTVAGDYIGNSGALEIETVLGDDTSSTDQLIITGNTSGTTNVRVINVGGTGDQTVEGIKIIDVGGSSAGTFSLLGSYVFEGDQAVVAGAYAYRLYQGGVSTPADGDWYLRSTLLSSGTPLYQAGAPVYEAYSSVLQRFNSLDTLQQRVGSRVWSVSGDKSANTGQGSDGGGYGVWGRIVGQHDRLSPHSSTTGADYTVDTWQLQAGTDIELMSSTGGNLVGGLSVRYGTINGDITSAYGNGTISSNGYGLGSTLTWYGNGGFYVDGHLNLTWFDNDLNSTTAATRLASGINGFGYALGVEAGQQIAVGPGWSLTPQAQLSFSGLSYRDFTDAFGSAVSLGRDNDLTLRLGLSSDYENSWTDEAGVRSRLQAYGIANLYYDLSPDARTDVAGVSFRNSQERLWGGLGLGGTYAWDNERYAVHGQAGINTSLADLSGNTSFNGTIGFTVKF
ncbi:autotransporter outer membrane beta-barrel domain-containing protein [Agrobacterium tumefaciens]|uniref:autotransporter family protein n=1 Tax=Agrobacterium tumefaciens TaxID=358 RepID=UPI0021D2BBE5|nr:autotransporter outer membrane beta-barrel domain-containing protein [Agrobacterium tumefaciens]UXS05430.1 autotransporter outer membrane beta-barrel domain-containing protein [Agrobacterium tumefaciens]